MAQDSMMEAARSRKPAVAGASVVDLAPKTQDWDGFVSRSNPGSYLQTSAWAEVKAPNGWTPIRFMGAAATGAATAIGAAGPDVDGEEVGRASAFGAQLLVRRPRSFPWAFAYAPRGPILE